MNGTKKQRWLATAGVVALAGLTLMCRPDRTGEPTATGAPQLSAAQVATVTARSQLPHGRADVAWVGELHTRAMQDALGRRAELSRLTREERCAQLVRLVRSYFPEVKRRSGIADDAVLDQAIVAARAHVGCDRVAGPLSIFAAPAATAALSGSDTIVTGAYEAYVPLLESALTGASSPAAAVASIDQVLVRASTLPAADFQVLAAMASIAASSAWYWYEYTSSTGDFGGGPAMAIFRLQSECTWQQFAKADLKGAFGAAGALRLLGFTDMRLLIAAFFGGAGFASAYFLYQCIEQES